MGRWAWCWHEPKTKRLDMRGRGGGRTVQNTAGAKLAPHTNHIHVQYICIYKYRYTYIKIYFGAFHIPLEYTPRPIENSFVFNISRVLSFANGKSENKKIEYCGSCVRMIFDIENHRRVQLTDDERGEK